MIAHDSLNTTHTSASHREESVSPDQPATESDKDRLERARRYSRIRVTLGMAATMLFFAVTVLLVLLGVTTWIESISYRISPNPYLALLIFSALFGFLTSIIYFPVKIYSGYLLEHRFELSNQSFGAWLWDGIKGTMVGVLLGTPILLLFYYFLRTFEAAWWLPVSIVLIVFSVILARLAPTVIFPLFYKFKPLEDGTLRERIVERCETVGMNVRGVYQFDMSTKTKKANAALAGIGKAKRIILGDTLLEEFTHDEVDVVFCHELGHYKLGHIGKSILVGTVSTVVSLYIAAQLYATSITWFGFESVTQLAALPLLTIWLGAYSLLTGPIENWLSRRHEYEADRFALELTGNKHAFISAMKKLAAMNLSDPEPPRWVEVLFHTHPSINKRIQVAESYS